MVFDESRADFLPKGSHSWEDLRVAVLGNLRATIGLLEQIPLQEQTVEELNGIEYGTYVLPETPTVGLLKLFPDYKNGTAEIGLFCIDGQWIISLNEGLEAKLPNPLSAIQHDGIFQADVHSHPGDDPGS